ncbi:uncharacterized protein LOC122250076 [Penaeus japonicus]|uniref:uncharacterized protein LOC122250076 n=1 Tax=Penaeus japonicus TaxID=27405 RepID=UPI001C70CB3F|nr:uncharacterized protein LOC122250076 [Penaeus japonicus]
MHAGVRKPVYFYTTEDGEQFPAVDLVVYGMVTMFMIDTSYSSTIVTEEQAKEWGVLDDLPPDPDDEDSLGCLVIYVEDSHCNTDVYVERVAFNLLGCDFLMFNCCRLDLDPEHPSLTLRNSSDEDLESYVPKKPVVVAGKEIEAYLDTSEDSFMTCRREDIEGMSIEISDSFCEWQDFDNILVSAFGHEATGTLCVDDVKNPYLGLQFLRGAVMEFEHDGSVNVFFPSEKKCDVE